MLHRFSAHRPQPAMCVALLALFLALGGTSYAAVKITSNQIKDNTIRSKDIRNRTLQVVDVSPSALAALQGNRGPAGANGAPGPKGDTGAKGTLPSAMMWIDHFGFLAGDASVTTTHNSVNSGVGGGLTALVISSSTLGDTATGGGNKVVHRALEVPPGYTVKGVRVCYELSNARSFITQIRLSQVQNPPSTASVLLDDATDHTAAGPVCVNSTATSINPSLGAVIVSLRLNYGDISDKIALRSVGLDLAAS